MFYAMYFQDENLGGWRVTRVIDGQPRVDFTIPQDYILKNRAKVSV